jgi:hypothetical protein
LGGDGKKNVRIRKHLWKEEGLKNGQVLKRSLAFTEKKMRTEGEKHTFL